jgi:ATP-dependent helicase HrpB
MSAARSDPSALPVATVLPDLKAALILRPNAVLVAPPGAGKTTTVGPALLDEPWATGAIWLLSPRRLAARAAAERMAALAGEAVGGRIGYATRLDSKHGRETRLLVMTYGLFRNRLLADPELKGVSAILFDEVHERSLDGDFALALTMDVQQGLRDDLRLLAMSATLDGARFSALMGGAQVIESQGRTHPLTIRHIPRGGTQSLADAMVGAVRTVLAAEEEGDILAFLPGIGDIERVAGMIETARLPLVIHRLHGASDPALQQAALVRDRIGRRKLILSTSIAETSLTIDGVRIVIDSGMARRPRFDHGAGMVRLVTERASQAAAVQRAGRAARQGPGVAYRLWEEAATAGMPRFEPPEIHESELMPVVLDCASWGIVDPRQLNWLEPPIPAGVASARRRLAAIGAVDDRGRITAHGTELARVPLPTALAHMLVRAGEAGVAAIAAQLAVLLSERGLGGYDADLEVRLRGWRRARGDRAEGAWRLARRLAALVGGSGAARSADDDGRIGELIAIAYPDRVARRRRKDGGDFLSVGGRAYSIDAADPLARHEWLAIADAQGSGAGARILAAAPIAEADALRLLTDQIMAQDQCRYDAASDRVLRTQMRALGAITLASAPAPRGDGSADVAARMDAVRTGGLSLLGWGEKARALADRARYAGTAALGADVLMESLDEWLPPLLERCRGLRDLDDSALAQALLGRLDWGTQQALDRAAPAQFVTPAGVAHAIDYGADAGPTVTCRVQELFGLAEHPAVGSPPVPLVLSLTSPAHRPVQTTRDLPGFWAGSWRDVVKDMRGRYPKHVWPDDPVGATASLKTKAALARGRAKPD